MAVDNDPFIDDTMIYLVYPSKMAVFPVRKALNNQPDFAQRMPSPGLEESRFRMGIHTKCARRFVSNVFSWSGVPCGRLMILKSPVETQKSAPCIAGNSQLYGYNLDNII